MRHASPPPAQRIHAPRTAHTPWWRTQRAGRIITQVLFLFIVLALAGYFYRNMMQSLRALGLGFSFRFLVHEAGFGISEGIAYDLSDSYTRALWVGIVNSAKVAFLGIIFASIIGLFVGLARLSSNWLVRKAAQTYIEIFRNIPLLLQLLFWYGAVMLKLPPVRQAIALFDQVFLSQRGLYIPRILPSSAFPQWRWLFVAALVAGAVAYVWRREQLRRADRPGFPSLWAAGVFAVVLAAGLPALGSPVILEPPVLERFNFVGGVALTPEFAALLFGLAVYTGAFIAEVVRGSVQSVDKGQREAAEALGLRPLPVTYLVVLPQALRSMIPPLTNQYLNLTKNSSLAVAIGYPELFNIGTTTMNQTGQTIPVFMVIVGVYLTLSLVTSLFMNWWNRRLKVV